MNGFGQRLWTGLQTHGALTVGIDPHASLLAAWGLDASAAGAREFGLRTVEAAAGRVAAVKVQVAFYERFGSAGYAALEDVLAAARAAGLLVIADAKRGDIGSTMAGYAEAWLSAGSPLEADAVTLSPYLGAESLYATLKSAIRAGKGAFVLAATSNPEARSIQASLVPEPSGDVDEQVAGHVAREIGGVNMGSPGALGPIGLVIGATVDRGAYGLTDTVLAGVPILAPGFGAQGAEPADLGRRFGYVASNVLASESRSILTGGPAGLAERIERRAAVYREVARG